MRHHETVQFHTYKDKTYILQLKIETSSYDRFKYTFRTDKYINLCQWEYIYSKLRNSVSGVFRHPDSWKNKKNKFTIDDLIVSYEFVDKAEGVINYKTVNYDLDWIVKATINKSSTIRDSFSIQGSQNSSSSPKKRSSSSSKESNAQNVENLIIDSDDEHIHEIKKVKLDENDDDVKLSVLQPSNHFKPRKDKNDSGKQSRITNWVTNRKEKPKPQKSKEPVPSTSKDALSHINKEKLQQMNEFVVRSEQEEIKKQQRKEELKNYVILNCYNMDDHQIIEIIKSIEHEIDCLFENDSTELSTRNTARINPCDITASNILSEKQTMLVLKTIEKLRSDDGKESAEDVLYNVALPRAIIELFKKHHKLKTEEAVERIKTQEEKKSLFKEEFNESY